MSKQDDLDDMQEELFAADEPQEDVTQEVHITPERPKELPSVRDRGPFGRLMDDNFLQFASYSICDRALPTVEDGLKPVQRRILHAMWEKDDGRFTKVAGVVGNAMHYHPHGDAAIKDAIVTLANKRYLIQGQGNFGNILTGDEAAAARYIECRLTKLAREHIFSPKVTEYVPSYDGRNKEPVLLPAKLPLSLMLGVDGIAVGLSTTILPHNFIELLEAEIAILQKKPCPTLVPDFITGGMMDASEYDNGRGSVKVRARIEERKNEKNKLFITSTPYGVTTDRLADSIEKTIKTKKLPIRHIDNFTAEKVEIELSLTPGSKAEDVKKKLYAFTECERKITSRVVVLRDNRPCEMTVPEMLAAHAELLKDIFRREFEVRLGEIKALMLRKTLEAIFIENRIYKRIESAKTADSVAAEIRKGFVPFRDQLEHDLTDEEIETLLKIPIRRISLYDINRHLDEMRALREEMAEIEDHLAHLARYATKYLKGIIKEYAKEFPRLTEISDGFQEIDERALTATELTLRLSEDRYIGHEIRQGSQLFACSSLDKVYILWSDGRYRFMPPPDKLLADAVYDPGKDWLDALRPRAPIRYFDTGIYQRDDVFTCVYYEPIYGFTYIKRFTWGGMIMNKDYNLVPEGSTIILFCKGTPEAIYVKFKYIKGQRITQQIFDPSEARVSSAGSKGIQMTPKQIERIDTRKGQWWVESEGSTKGALL
ncbi:MAG: DNA topoisomerase IV subunit A [bacterium]|nr:DNA topoisomerase IV subunit A [bacterium]